MKKTCPNCGVEQSLRKRVCECEYEFYKSKKITKRTVKDWTALKPGDRIKVSGGPYFLSKTTGKKISMGAKGEYTVSSVCDNHIMAVGKGRSQEVIYMGKIDYDDNLSIHRQPHKVFILK
tara:strand:+ start:248 stop:607 length:360 start_codon:yes stop_codon:yes gene_type:complete